MRKVVFVALGLFLFSAFPLAVGTANAADLDWRTARGYDRSFKDEPVMVPRYGFSWTGFYLGGNLGYSWGDTETLGVGGTPFGGLGDGFVIHPSGWTGGLQGGYNWQTNNFVVGMEIDLGILDATDEQNSGGATFVEAEYGGYGTLTGRLGLAQDRWLFYLKGGLALANIQNTAGAVGVPAEITDEDDTRVGWTLGGGAEYAFHPNWSMKIEYMYMDFGEDVSTSPAGDAYRHENEISAIKVGLNYRFQPVDIPLR